MLTTLATLGLCAALLAAWIEAEATDDPYEEGW